jgi:hypothetical protein
MQPPPEQTAPAAVQLLPLQHGWPSPPQVTQPPEAVQARLDPQAAPVAQQG